MSISSGTDNSGMFPCKRCGAVTSLTAKFCGRCGVIQPSQPDEPSPEHQRVPIVPASDRVQNVTSVWRMRSLTGCAVVALVASAVAVWSHHISANVGVTKEPPTGNSPQSVSAPPQILTKNPAFMQFLHPLKGDDVLEPVRNFSGDSGILIWPTLAV